MTLEQARQRRDQIVARTDIGPAQKSVLLMRLHGQLRREHPEVDLADLG